MRSLHRWQQARDYLQQSVAATLQQVQPALDRLLSTDTVAYKSDGSELADEDVPQVSLMTSDRLQDCLQHGSKVILIFALSVHGQGFRLSNPTHKLL